MLYELKVAMIHMLSLFNAELVAEFGKYGVQPQFRPAKSGDKYGISKFGVWATDDVRILFGDYRGIWINPKVFPMEKAPREKGGTYYGPYKAEGKAVPYIVGQAMKYLSDRMSD